MTEPRNLSSLSPEQKRALLADLLRQKAAEVKSSSLSHGQRALWFVQALDASSTAYNVSVTMRIRVSIDAGALRQAVVALVARHPQLRTTFNAEQGEPRQLVHPEVETPFDVVDARGWSEDILQRRVAERHRVPFDLEKGPVFRAVLFVADDTDSVLLLAAHHIVVDGWSLGILVGELQHVYTAQVSGTAPALPRLTFDYHGFVEWQAATLVEKGPAMEAFWRETLAAPLPVLEIPPDHARPPVQRLKGGSVSFSLTPALASGVDALARAQGATTFGVLLAAYVTLLARYSGQDDIIVGSPTLGRNRSEFESVVGYFVNPVALRVTAAGSPTFRAMLDRVKSVLQAALANQDYPFPLLVERLQPPRDPSRSPVFQTLFNLLRVGRFGRGVATGTTALPFEPYYIPQEEGQFDLALDIVEAENTLGGMLRYSDDLFDRSTVERMAAHYQTLLENIVAAPDSSLPALSLLSEAERKLVVVEWNETARPYDPTEGVEAMVAAQAARIPDAVACVCDGRTMTYRMLDEASGRLAGYLRTRGVGPDVLVGICLKRSPELLVALLGVLKAGGAYVPLDPAFPAQRLALMVEDSGLGLIITDADSESTLPDSPATVLRIDDAWPAIMATDAVVPAPQPGQQRAYVLYTSGSTGRPKGVQIPRRALTNFLRAMQTRPGMEADDVLLAVTTLSFDIAGLELFLPLSVGGRVVIATREQASDGVELRDLLVDSCATIMQATPATWRLLIDAGWRGDPSLKVLCGGEPLPVELARQLLTRCGSLWNMYGPTETTIWSTVDRVTLEDRITIGRPIDNTQVYILDDRLEPTPVGLRGELCIAGDGVALGYLDRPDLTAERFVANPFSPGSGALLYRTGDLGRWLADGRLDCLGRADQQVKVRGFRIELGEVEGLLERHEAVRQAVASVHDEGGGDRRLVAYVSYHPGAEATASDLRRFLRLELPDYMVPSLFIEVDTMPLTPNGKVDRRALPAPLAGQHRPAETVAPRTDMEQMVASIWRDVLGVPQVSVHDNFFDIGGHSLLAMQVISRLERQAGVTLHPSRLMLDTLEQIAATCAPSPAATPEPASGGATAAGAGKA